MTKGGIKYGAADYITPKICKNRKKYTPFLCKCADYPEIERQSECALSGNLTFLSCVLSGTGTFLRIKCPYKIILDIIGDVIRDIRDIRDIIRDIEA